jgi:hypothetical protein
MSPIIRRERVSLCTVHAISHVCEYTPLSVGTDIASFPPGTRVILLGTGELGTVEGHSEGFGGEPLVSVFVDGRLARWAADTVQMRPGNLGLAGPVAGRIGSEEE